MKARQLRDKALEILLTPAVAKDRGLRLSIANCYLALAQHEEAMWKLLSDEETGAGNPATEGGANTTPSTSGWRRLPI